MSNPHKVPAQLDQDLLRAVEEILAPGQSTADFIEEAVRDAIIRAQFVRKGLEARDSVRVSGRYSSSDQVLIRLEAILKNREKGRDRP